MRVTIESTTRIVEANGVPCRVWEGATEKGVPVMCLVARVAARADEDLSEFEADLKETAAPSAEAASVFPLRLVL